MTTAAAWKDRPDSPGWHFVAWCDRWAFVHRFDGRFEIFGIDSRVWSGRIYGPVDVPSDPGSPEVSP